MRVKVTLIALFLLSFGAMDLFGAQSQPSEKKATNPQKEKSNDVEMGKSYATLRREQKRLVDDYVNHYNQTTGNKVIPQQAYDNARLSIRTTFGAVTHALLNAKLTDLKGKSLGRAIDLVDAIDEVMGEESGLGSDRQFRVYVYLKPNAVEILSRSLEFFHDKDNVNYHKGFPISYRMKNGPPSIQFSISRDKKMSDIDVDYRASTFPKALVNGHLTAANSDVRAGNNLDRHDQRWAGLDGWWREVFGLLGSGAKPPKETASERMGNIPLNPGVKADQGIDTSTHDFLKTWVVDKQPNKSVAYFSRRSYSCLEAIVPKKKGKPIAPGMIRLQTAMAMKQVSDSIGTADSVTEVFETADKWSQGLKEEKNAYGSEFRLVSVPKDMASDEQCGAIGNDESIKQPKEKYYATAFRGRQGDSRNKVMSLLWAQEGGYWKIIAIRIEDGSDAGIVPNNSAAQVEPTEEEPKNIAGDPAAVKDITQFYLTWILRRDATQASHFASPRSYQCLTAPSGGQKELTALTRIQLGLKRPLEKIPSGASLPDMMSSVQPVDALVRPVEQENSKAFAIMAVPDQMAGSFLCQNRHLPEKSPELKQADAKYGAYYLSASRLNFGEEQSPALLLLWTREKEGWKIVAWAVEVP
jgi:hypothetical protein